MVQYLSSVAIPTQPEWDRECIVPYKPGEGIEPSAMAVLEMAHVVSRNNSEEAKGLRKGILTIVYFAIHQKQINLTFYKKGQVVWTILLYASGL